MRSDPTGLQMWIKIGNPNACHRIITNMLLFTLDVCNKLEAEYWADWGTLLGV